MLICSYHKNQSEAITLKKMFMFVMSAKEDDVLCIHIDETGETYKFSYYEVLDIVFLGKLPERFEIKK